MKQLRKSLALLLCFAFFMSGTAAFAASDDAQSAGAKKQELASFTKKLMDMQTLSDLKDKEGIVPGKLVVKFKNKKRTITVL